MRVPRVEPIGLAVWLLVLLLFVAGDIGTTLVGLSLGAVEANSIVTALVARPSAGEMLAAKAAVLAVAAVGSRLVAYPYRHAPPASLAVCGALIVAWNLRVVMLL